MRIARVFFDTHMGKNFRGLKKVCAENGLKNEDIQNSYLVFINSKHTKFKVLLGNKYLVYHDNGNKPVPLDAIRFLPRAFEGEQFVFDKAVKALLQEKLSLPN